MRRRLRVSAAFDPHFTRASAAYDVLGGEIREQAARWRDWPDVADYDAWTPALARAAARPLAFRDVPRPSVAARGGYDPFIHETGLIPTRSRSWHDFFNACIWTRLPRAKLAVHAWQLAESRARTGPGRTRRQDWLTHFDECGVVLVSAGRRLLERVASLDWQAAFVDERAEFVRGVRVYCFGHAVLEALREPYVGLMGKALLCHDPGGPEQACAADDAAADAALRRLDGWLATQLSAPSLPRLHALPVLGVPGWHAANERRSFYDQPRYFRRFSAERSAALGSGSLTGVASGGAPVRSASNPT